MGAPVAFFEVISDDPERARKFYSVKIYMRVDDLGTCLDRAERLGGRRMVPPTDLPGDLGRFAIFADPDGNAVGLWS